MKNWSKIFLVLAFPLIMVACSKSNDNPGTNDTLTSIITQGTWVVHLYLNDGKDETNTFTGYVLTFNSNGSLQASKGGNNTSGTWAEVADSGKTKLVITWIGGGIPVELLEIQEDWVLKSKSSTLVELTDTGSSGSDELHLHKQ